MICRQVCFCSSSSSWFTCWSPFPVFLKPAFQTGPISDTIPLPDLSCKQWGGGHNWYILIPKWHLKAFCSAAKPALLEASDDINFSLFPEVCRKLKCRKCCGKKLKLCGKKKGRLTGNEPSIGQLAWSEAVRFAAYQHMRGEK